MQIQAAEITRQRAEAIREAQAAAQAEVDRVRTQDADETDLDDLRTDIERLFQTDAEAEPRDADSTRART